jgi:hypothetical protein
VSNPDTSYFHDAMREKDKEKHNLEDEIMTDLRTEVFTAIWRFV